MIAAPGLANLIPAKTGDGSLSDGVKLMRARARARSRATADIRELLAAPDWSHRPATANRLINGWVLDVPAAQECLRQLPDDRDALLRFYAQEWSLPDGPETEFLNKHPRDHALPVQCARTRQARPRQATRLEEPAPGTPPRRGQDHQKRTQPQGTTRTRRLKDKLRRCSENVGMTTAFSAHQELLLSQLRGPFRVEAPEQTPGHAGIKA